MTTLKNVDVIVGLQYGSEGKGCIAQHLAKNYQHIGCCNSSQAGHTIYVDGVKFVNRQLPSGWCNPNAKLYLGAGSMISPIVLKEEIEIIENAGYKIKERLVIDKNAGLVLPWHITEENKIYDIEGQSTREGVGAAWRDRVIRKSPVASQYQPFKDEGYQIDDVSQLLTEIKGDLLLEGCQGFGLSLFHGQYPHVTSRDTTPASLLAGVGINHHRLRRVFGVMRRYPIRIHGNSGPMGEELNWETVTKRCNSLVSIEEKTTVTKKVRRVAEIDWEMLRQAVEVCGVTDIAITFLNYCNWIDYEKTKYLYLSDESKQFIWDTIRNLNTKVSIINTSPMPEHTVKLPALSQLYLHEAERGNKCKGMNLNNKRDENC